MDYKNTSLLLAVMLLGWQIMLWKNIKLPKMVDYILSTIAVILMIWFVYSIFLS